MMRAFFMPRHLASVACRIQDIASGRLALCLRSSLRETDSRYWATEYRAGSDETGNGLHRLDVDISIQSV